MADRFSRMDRLGRYGWMRKKRFSRYGWTGWDMGGHIGRQIWMNKYI